MREGKLRARRLRVNVHGWVCGHGAVFCYRAIGVVGERERGVKERSCGKEWQDGEGETWMERRAGVLICVLHASCPRAVCKQGLCWEQTKAK